MHRVTSFFARTLVHILGFLSLNGARRVGAWVGRIAWKIQDRTARVTLVNLSLCYPQMSVEERELLAKKSLQETFKIGAETFVLWRRGKMWARSITTMVNPERVQATLAEGRGVLLLAPHLGNWEIAGAHLDQFAEPLCMYVPPKKQYMDRIVFHSRHVLGVKPVPATRQGVAAQFRALKAGGLVAVLPDQVPVQGGIFSPFFGKEAYTMTLVHGFITRTQCKVVFTFAQRTDAGFCLHFVDAPPAIYSKNESESVMAMNDAVANCVALCPEQYQWEYKRFRNRPEGVPDPYAGC